MRCLSLFSLLIVASSAAQIIRAPYVQMATHDSIRVVWRTNGDIAPTVKVGLKPDELTTEVPAAQILTRLHETVGGEHAIFKDAATDTQQFEATISGLEPRTTYFYGIFDGQERITAADETYQFTTHPTPGSDAPVYFWVVGDSGTGGTAQAQVHNAMRDYVSATERKLDLYIHVGDMAYGSGTNNEFSDRFFKMYEPTLRNTVCWASMGNHEGRTSKGETGVGPYYDAYILPAQGQAGGLPSGTEAYYSFDYGKVHFICLDSHDLDRRPSGAMAQWLKADLDKTKADFLVAFFHHPPYTKGSHDSDKEVQLIEMREHIMPILESGGVDIVFTGHSHIYERSMLIDGAYQTPTTAEGVVLDDGDGNPEGDGAYKKSKGLQPHNGVIQIVTGHGGTGVRMGSVCPIMKRIVVENGSCLISIAGDTLSAEMISLNGVIRDTFAIQKKGTVEHTVIVNPAKPDVLDMRPKKATPQTAPKDATPLIAKNAIWSYLAGEHPSDDWTSAEFDASAWKKGKAGFGYSDDDDTTVFDDMEGRYTVVYLRNTFTLPDKANLKAISLNVSYDDAFIAYINGKEVLRVGIDKGRGAAADGFTVHEANGNFNNFPLPQIRKFLKPGEKNVLTIEGHNANMESSDFTLHPTLLIGK